MQILPSPQRNDATLTLARQGDSLILNGRRLDLANLPEGATLPAEAIDCAWIAGPITRQGGVLRIPVFLPHDPIPDPAPPEADAVRFPQPITVTADGPIALPSYTPEEPAHD